MITNSEIWAAELKLRRKEKMWGNLVLSAMQDANNHGVFTIRQIELMRDLLEEFLRMKFRD